MITKWKVSNFKSIRDGDELDLAALTIFAGANSSGKSTFIQSILLIAQTLANKVSSRSVVLNGAHTSLGQFDDLKSNSSDLDQIIINCTCRPLLDSDRIKQQRSAFTNRTGNYYGHRLNNIQEIGCEIAFDADPSGSEREFFQIQPRLVTSQLNCKSRDEDNVDQNAEIFVRYSNKALSQIEGMGSASEIDDDLRSGLAYDVTLDDASMKEVKERFLSARSIGCVFRHFLPERVIYGIDTIKEDANDLTRVLQDVGFSVMGLRRRLGADFFLSKKVISVLREVIGDVIKFDDVFIEKQKSILDSEYESMSFEKWHERFRSIPRIDRMKVQSALREEESLFDRVFEAMKLSNTSPNKSFAFVQYRPPIQIFEAIQYLNDFFSSSLKYLGPLRDAPKPLYPLAPEAGPNDVGIRGEHTASILDLHKNKKIRYIPTSHFNEPTVNRNTSIRTLEAAVIDWLQYLGVANSVNSTDKGKLGHELKVSLSDLDEPHDLTHVGVGVSQVLPILVMCLLADADSTLVFEQPELHLHPKVQTLLGDFFLSMALCNKQCIVETHSEYLIDRLRFRIAAATSENELNKYTKIYFVEKPSQNSTFREVVINEYGAIFDWPEGFFDQSQHQAEEILRAALNKKREKSQD